MFTLTPIWDKTIGIATYPHHTHDTLALGDRGKVADFRRLGKHARSQGYVRACHGGCVLSNKIFQPIFLPEGT